MSRLETLPSRVPDRLPPAQATDSGWAVDGWGAHVLVPGRDAEPRAEIELVRETSDAFHEAVAGPSQAIHGDMLPNVLVHDRLPPAVIDGPPYFRPAATARAIAVTDAVTFRGAPLSLLEEWAIGPDWHQLLVRAVLYRLGPTGVFALHDRLMGNLRTHLERVAPVVDALVG